MRNGSTHQSSHIHLGIKGSFSDVRLARTSSTAAATSSRSTAATPTSTTASAAAEAVAAASASKSYRTSMRRKGSSSRTVSKTRSCKGGLNKDGLHNGGSLTLDHNTRCGQHLCDDLNTPDVKVVKSSNIEKLTFQDRRQARGQGLWQPFQHQPAIAIGMADNGNAFRKGQQWGLRSRSDGSCKVT